MADNNNQNTIEKRGRGRPRKYPVNIDNKCLDNIEKRGRGRPRKNVDNIENKCQGNAEKNGRGRPRKYPDNTGNVKLALKTQLTRAEIDAMLAERARKMQGSRLKYYQKHREQILAKNKARLDKHPEWTVKRNQLLKARRQEMVKDKPKMKVGRPPKNKAEIDNNSQIMTRQEYITMLTKNNPVGRPRKAYYIID